MIFNFECGWSRQLAVERTALWLATTRLTAQRAITSRKFWCKQLLRWRGVLLTCVRCIWSLLQGNGRGIEVYCIRWMQILRMKEGRRESRKRRESSSIWELLKSAIWWVTLSFPEMWFREVGVRWYHEVVTMLVRVWCGPPLSALTTRRPIKKTQPWHECECRDTRTNCELMGFQYASLDTCTHCNVVSDVEVVRLPFLSGKRLRSCVLFAGNSFRA